MAKQLVMKDGRWFFIDEETLTVKEVHIDTPVLSVDEQREILKLYVKAIIG
jgi:hypothetical protein